MSSRCSRGRQRGRKAVIVLPSAARRVIVVVRLRRLTTGRLQRSGRGTHARQAWTGVFDGYREGVGVGVHAVNVSLRDQALLTSSQTTRTSVSAVSGPGFRDEAVSAGAGGPAGAGCAVAPDHGRYVGHPGDGDRRFTARGPRWGEARQWLLRMPPHPLSMLSCSPARHSPYLGGARPALTGQHSA